MSCVTTSTTIYAHAGIVRGSASCPGRRSSRRDRRVIVVKAASPHPSVVLKNHNSNDEDEEEGPPASRPLRPEQPRDAIPDDRRHREELVGKKGFRASRRVVLGGATLTAAASAFFSDPAATFSGSADATIARPPPAAAATATAPAAADLAPFVGRARRLIISKSHPSKAGFFMRYPNSWVKAMDRPGGEKGETLALVGNFKDIDTVSIRREPLDMHEDFVSAAAGYSSDTDGAAVDGVARKVAEVLTSAERSAVEANQDFGVVGGVENGRSGVMDFRLGDAAVSVGPGADPGSSQPYFYYDFYTEVCRANIEEGSGGAKQCVGPRGDMLDTIQRRNYTVATQSGGFLYTVKASALESRWDVVGPLLREVAGSFRVPQAE